MSETAHTRPDLSELLSPSASARTESHARPLGSRSHASLSACTHLPPSNPPLHASPSTESDSARNVKQQLHTWLRAGRRPHDDGLAFEVDYGEARPLDPARRDRHLQRDFSRHGIAVCRSASGRLYGCGMVGPVCCMKSGTYL